MGKVNEDALTAISHATKSSVFDCLNAIRLALVSRLTGCLLLKSKGAGAACSGAGARLQLTGCQVRESAKAGVFVTDGAQAELRSGALCGMASG